MIGKKTIVVLAIAGGFMVWYFDIIMHYYVYYQGQGKTFWEAVVIDHTGLTLYIRSFLMLGVLGVSVIFAQIFTKRLEAEEDVLRGYQFKNLLNNLLTFSLKDCTLEEILEYSIDEITSLPWLEVEKKGAIFLKGKKPETLVLIAEKGLSEPIKSMCAEVPFGKCLCGRVAQSKEIICVDRLDERHVNKYEGMQPHGHYCIPILSGAEEKLIGVLNLYLKEKIGKKEDNSTLMAITNVLASILERKQAEKKLLRIYKQDMLKDALIRDVSHELKTPVAKQKMQMELLKQVHKKHGLVEECSKFINVIEATISRQESVIHNILNLSRLEAGGRKYQKESIAINLILNDVLDDYKTMLDNYQIELVSELPEIMVISDPDMLFIVFANLINNAIKYRRNKGQAQIEISVEKENDEIAVRIKDNGIGMTELERQQVFEKFYQVSASAAGSGIGLSIAKHIVGDLGGKIWLESLGINEGTTAVVKLPMKARKNMLRETQYSF